MTGPERQLADALIDMGQLKCDELKRDMRFLLALYDKLQRAPAAGADCERLATIRAYLRD